MSKLDDADSELFPCPCCEALTLRELGAYEICEKCGWEDDPVQSNDPTYRGGANGESLDDCKAKRKWTGLDWLHRPD